jgi:hypothetical protein
MTCKLTKSIGESIKFFNGFNQLYAYIKTNYSTAKMLFILILLSFNACRSKGQVFFLREGVTVNNTETGTWYGDNIPRNVPTLATYRNNSITSVNTNGYIVQAGDDGPSSLNNNLDGEIVTGNKLVWNGVNTSAVITHGLIVGYNINSIVKYNYIERAPYGIIYKSGTETGENMTFTSGGCAYNICRNGKFAVRMKGINGVKAYNNTFYNDDGSGWYFVFISANMDQPVKSPSIGAKIFNNIFYSTTQFPMIKIESGCLTGFECDYNIYWCTAGEPKFMIDGVSTSWGEWQALGYDTHSIIADPNFINTIDLVPATRLNYGKNLGSEWQTGLSSTAIWKVGASPATANQNGTWQVGARVHNTSIPVASVTISATGGLATIIKDNGTLQLNAAILPANATDHSVTWTIVNGTGKATISATGLVTAVDNGIVTAYATTNDGSGAIGTFVITISNQTTLSSGSVGNDDTNDIKIFVTKNELVLRFNLDFISYKANLYNLQGGLISGKYVENDSLSFDISKIPSGTYILELSKGISKKVFKIRKP